MLMNKHITLLLIVLCIAVPSINAQYKKKVVSYVNKVLAPASYGLSTRQSDFIASTISKNTQMERFTYVPLPENVISQFSGEASRMKSFTSDNVRPLIEKTLAPKFLELLDINKELLSEKNLTEVERNTFLATKAQSAGLSASQLESILNSGFFYIPYVEYYKRSTEQGERDVKNDQGKVIRTVPTLTLSNEIKLGLLWFQLKIDKSNNPSVQFIGSANGWKGSGIERSETKDADDGTDVDWKTFTEVIHTSAVNIANETKKIEQFKLTGTVSETTTFGVRLNLGTLEGIGLDDSYWIEELEETESGEIVKSRRGFVKIRQIGNNKQNESATSLAQTITGSNYSPGLSATEISMLGLNAVFGLGSIPVNIKPFDNEAAKFSLTKYDFAIKVTGETKKAYGPFAWFQVNIANKTNISELWGHGGVSIGFLDVDGKFYLPKYNSLGSQIGVDSTNDIGVSLAFNVNIGLLKKFYLYRFGIIFGADVGYSMTNFSATGKDKDEANLKYSMTHAAFGFTGKVGTEVYITPAFSIGGGVNYTAAPVGDNWSISVEDAEENETKLDEAKGPEVNYSGLGVYFWLNYALPSLF